MTICRVRIAVWSFCMIVNIKTLKSSSNQKTENWNIIFVQIWCDAFCVICSALWLSFLPNIGNLVVFNCLDSLAECEMKCMWHIVVVLTGTEMHDDGGDKSWICEESIQFAVQFNVISEVDMHVQWVQLQFELSWTFVNSPTNFITSASCIQYYKFAIRALRRIMITLVRLFIVNQHAICVRNFTAADAQSFELFNCQEIYGICIKNASEKLIDFRVDRHFHTQRGGHCVWRPECRVYWHWFISASTINNCDCAAASFIFISRRESLSPNQETHKLVRWCAKNKVYFFFLFLARSSL